MVLLSDDKDYFFILYVVYVAINVLLAAVALLHWPSAEQLELIDDSHGYEVSATHWLVLDNCMHERCWWQCDLWLLKQRALLCVSPLDMHCSCQLANCWTT